MKSITLILALVAFSVSAAPAPKETDAEAQRRLIAVLKSDAPAAEKAISCKRLVVYATKDAVPALADLLADPELASWARIPLEVIPGPAPDDAFRAALGKLQGKLLIGVINSIGVRRDAKAVNGLTEKLKDPEGEVASAAAVALGRIGGAKAARTLTQTLSATSPQVRPAVAEGCILCAEKFLTENKASDATRLYDSVRKADLPRQKVLEATRGSILARGPAGLPMLLDELRSPDKARFSIGLRTARELPGRPVTEALAAEINRTSPERQGFLLLALAERTDAAVLPAVFAAARSGPPKLRLVAVGVLDEKSDSSSMPVLLEVAAGAGNEELRQAAMKALARLPGAQVDTEVCQRLQGATGPTRRALIELAGQRRIERAVPSIVSSTADADPAVRSAAVQALGALGSAQQAADLAAVLPRTSDAKERADIEMALVAICGRGGAACVPSLLPLTHSSDSALRIIALHALASAGGPQALGAVKSAVEDADEAVQDEAVRALSGWPSNWPDDAAAAEPLLALAKSGKKTSHQVLGLRGYLQYVEGDKKLRDGEKVEKVNNVVPLLKRPEEKRLAIAAIDAIPSPGALALLETFAAEPEISNDACVAIVGIVGKSPKGISNEQRRKALLVVVEKATNDRTKKKAEDMLKKSQ